MYYYKGHCYYWNELVLYTWGLYTNYFFQYPHVVKLSHTAHYQRVRVQRLWWRHPWRHLWRHVTSVFSAKFGSLPECQQTKRWTDGKAWGKAQMAWGAGLREALGLGSTLSASFVFARNCHSIFLFSNSATKTSTCKLACYSSALVIDCLFFFLLLRSQHQGFLIQRTLILCLFYLRR